MTTKLTLSGDISYDGELDNFLAAKVIAMVEQGENLSQPAQTAQSKNFLSTTIQQPAGLFADRSLVEAFTLTGAKTNPQRIAVAGQRSMEENGSEVFTSKDVIEQFRSGGVFSKNLARDMRKAVGQGLIFSVTGQRGQYKITDIARTAFKEGFEQARLLAPRTSNKKTRRGGVTQKLEVSDSVMKLPAGVSQEGYADYHDLKMKGDRLVWLLVFAANRGVDGLNSKEIEYLTRQVGDHINPTSIPGLTLSSIRKGLIAKSGAKFRSLEKGKVYLKGQVGGNSEKTENSN